MTVQDQKTGLCVRLSRWKDGVVIGTTLSAVAKSGRDDSGVIAGGTIEVVVQEGTGVAWRPKLILRCWEDERRWGGRNPSDS